MYYICCSWVKQEESFFSFRVSLAWPTTLISWVIALVVLRFSYPPDWYSFGKVVSSQFRALDHRQQVVWRQRRGHPDILQLLCLMHLVAQNTPLGSASWARSTTGGVALVSSSSPAIFDLSWCYFLFLHRWCQLFNFNQMYTNCKHKFNGELFY